MTNDTRGNALSVGDHVLVPCTIKSIEPGTNHLILESAYLMGDRHTCTMALDSDQIVAGDLQSGFKGDPKSAVGSGTLRRDLVEGGDGLPLGTKRVNAPTPENLTNPITRAAERQATTTNPMPTGSLVDPNAEAEQAPPAGTPQGPPKQPEAHAAGEEGAGASITIDQNQVPLPGTITTKDAGKSPAPASKK